MNIERYNELWELLVAEKELNLTEEEISAGWHYCQDQKMLTGPGTIQASYCTCPIKEIEEWKQTEEGLIMIEQLKALDELVKLAEEMDLEG